MVTDTDCSTLDGIQCVTRLNGYLGEHQSQVFYTELLICDIQFGDRQMLPIRLSVGQPIPIDLSSTLTSPSIGEPCVGLALAVHYFERAEPLIDTPPILNSPLSPLTNGEGDCGKIESGETVSTDPPSPSSTRSRDAPGINGASNGCNRALVTLVVYFPIERMSTANDLQFLADQNKYVHRPPHPHEFVAHPNTITLSVEEVGKRIVSGLMHADTLCSRSLELFKELCTPFKHNEKADSSDELIQNGERHDRMADPMDESPETQWTDSRWSTQFIITSRSVYNRIQLLHRLLHEGVELKQLNRFTTVIERPWYSNELLPRPKSTIASSPDALDETESQSISMLDWLGLRIRPIKGAKLPSSTNELDNCQPRVNNPRVVFVNRESFDCGEAICSTLLSTGIQPAKLRRTRLRGTAQTGVKLKRRHRVHNDTCDPDSLSPQPSKQPRSEQTESHCLLTSPLVCSGWSTVRHLSTRPLGPLESDVDRTPYENALSPITLSHSSIATRVKRGAYLCNNRTHVSNHASSAIEAPDWSVKLGEDERNDNELKLEHYTPRNRVPPKRFDLVNHDWELAIKRSLGEQKKFNSTCKRKSVDKNDKTSRVLDQKEARMKVRRIRSRRIKSGLVRRILAKTKSLAQDLEQSQPSPIKLTLESDTEVQEKTHQTTPSESSNYPESENSTINEIVINNSKIEEGHSPHAPYDYPVSSYPNLPTIEATMPKVEHSVIKLTTYSRDLVREAQPSTTLLPRISTSDTELDNKPISVPINDLENHVPSRMDFACSLDHREHVAHIPPITHEGNILELGSCCLPNAYMQTGPAIDTTAWLPQNYYSHPVNLSTTKFDGMHHHSDRWRQNQVAPITIPISGWTADTLQMFGGMNTDQSHPKYTSHEPLGKDQIMTKDITEPMTMWTKLKIPLPAPECVQFPSNTVAPSTDAWHIVPSSSLMPQPMSLNPPLTSFGTQQGNRFITPNTLTHPTNAIQSPNPIECSSYQKFSGISSDFTQTPFMNNPLGLLVPMQLQHAPPSSHFTPHSNLPLNDSMIPLDCKQQTSDLWYPHSYHGGVGVNGIPNPFVSSTTSPMLDATPPTYWQPTGPFVCTSNTAYTTFHMTPYSAPLLSSQPPLNPMNPLMRPNHPSQWYPGLTGQQQQQGVGVGAIPPTTIPNFWRPLDASTLAVFQTPCPLQFIS